MDLDSRTRNLTHFNVRSFALEDRHGRDVATIVAKIRYRVSAQGVVTLDTESPVIHIVDEPSSRAVHAGLLYASDLVDEKPGTDVLMLGTAHPPETPKDRPATSVDVSIRVETKKRTIKKMVRVHGTRVWQQGLMGLTPGPAVPLRPTPLIWELAYGGRDDSRTGDPLVEWRNPAGTGVAHDRASLVGQRVAQLEDPDAPLSSRKPAPAAFAPIRSHWSPRRELTGTHDEPWARRRAPIRPVDFDPRHHSVAPRELWTEAPLAGDEPVEVLGATPEGAWRFKLPLHAPHFFSKVGGGAEELPTHLDTFLVDADAHAVELTWRASFRLPRKLERIEAIYVVTPEGIPPEVLGDDPAPVVDVERIAREDEDFDDGR